MWESLPSAIKLQDLVLSKQKLLLLRDLEDRNILFFIIIIFFPEMLSRSFESVENAVGFGQLK